MTDAIKPESTAISNLASWIFARVDREDLAPLGEERRLGLAEAALEHLAAYCPGAPDIRITALDGRGTLLEVVNEDMPFLLVSTLAEINERGLPIALVAHPILALERGRAPRQLRLLGPAMGQELAPVSRESLIHIHIAHVLSAEERDSLAAALTRIYADIRAAVVDWLKMRNQIAAIATRYRANPPHVPADELAEAVQFLDWVLADNFTFLGLREYAFTDAELKEEPLPLLGLGILRDPAVKVLRRGPDLVVMTPEIRAFLQEPTPLCVAKANVKSTIHRRVYLDYIGIKRYDEAGQLAGELRLVGLFTATAYTNSVRAVPYLRHKVARVFEHAGFAPESHSGKALAHVLETFPRDELFQITSETLLGFALDILALGERPRLRVLARADRFERYVSVLVFVPKDRYDTQVRQRIGEYLAKAYQGRVSAAYPAYPEGPLARTHFIIGRSEGKTPEIGRTTLEADISAIVHTWADDFRDRAPEKLAWAEAFGAAYRDTYSPLEALRDIAVLEGLHQDAPFGFRFHRPPGEPATRVSLKVFAHQHSLSLSRRVPVIENCGFTVINERSFSILRPGGGESWLHEMMLERASGGEIDLTALEAALEQTLLEVFGGRLDADRFNLLVTECRLSPREADILRAYARYLRQIGVPYTQVYIADALARYPAAARMLVQFFALRFDPDLVAGTVPREAQIDAIRAALLAEIDRITSLDDDRIFRRMLNLIEATLRTNAFQHDRSTIAFKLACAAVDQLPLPRPLYEIFLSSTQVEGLHLRFGKVARGGLRWSDRPMDFRTEILGLVKAQQVKNAVIVPVGAKGGFIPKRLPPPGERDAWMAEGSGAYKTFIHGLLDLTDTIRDGEVIPPPRLLRYDGDDPYLVVAADKGTATFSDTANAISEAEGHWLSDAFASGGSAGYDHKKMGITARGAWEAVKRHFRELDRDIQTQPFTVAGVGDMSGDVFGNAMLLSPETRLVAAFDHRDIFIDPEPDAGKAFVERQRLFDKPRSSWADYDPALISRGGGVFSRSLKKIPLTDAMRALLELEGEDATPQVIMSAILRARVDLLWFGGIGTYVRATTESDLEAGDRANDAIRVTGAEIRARVVGEGANLGMTQRGRIEAARNGLRLNTDAIDNSAGVNSSDVEVNLKIAFAILEGEGLLTREARNALLVAMTGEVAGIVLRNNYLQSLALSLVQRKGVAAAAEMMALMRALEAEGRLDRKVEFLPSDAEIEARSARGEALMRPEIAVLLAYAKLALHDGLLASDVPDDPYLKAEIRQYFPAALRESFPEAIERHRLRREIAATQLANAVINQGGPGIVVRLCARTGRGVADIARAYVIARDVLDLASIHAAIDALDGKIPGARQNDLYAAAEVHIIEGMLWFLASCELAPGKGSPGMGALVDRFAAATGEVDARLAEDEAEEGFLTSCEALRGQEVPEDLAQSIAAMPLKIAALEASLIAETAGTDLAAARQTLGALEAHLGLDPLLRQGGQLEVVDAYEQLALDGALGAIRRARRAMVSAIIQRHGPGAAGMAAYAEARGERLAALQCEIGRIAAAPLTQARLSVLAGQLGEVVAAGQMR